MHQEFSVAKLAVAPALKCEVADLLLNCESTITMRVEAKELGYLQPATLARVDNTTTYDCICGILQ